MRPTSAIAGLRGLIDQRGATITIDAIGDRNSIVHKITDGGDYISALKNNQPTLHRAIPAT